MNGFENGRKKDAQASKTRLLQELEKLQARKKAVEKQLQLLRKKAEVPGPSIGKDSLVPSEATFGVKRPAASAAAAADAKRQRLAPSKEKRVQGVWKQCQGMVKFLKKHRNAGWFIRPVDIKLVPDYPDVIKTPMDLSTISEKLDHHAYKTPLEFRDDVRLVWSNCRTYNKPNTDVGRAGEQLSNEFEQRWAKVQQLWEDDLNGSAQDVLQTPATALAPSKQAHDAMRQLDSEMRERLQNSRGRPDVEPGQELTFEEKRKLSVKLGELPAEKLGRVLEIVEDDVKHTNESEAEIELDIDQLSTVTLRRLWDYVQSVASKEKPTKPKPSRPGQLSDSGADHGQERQAHNEPSSQARDFKTEQTRSQAECQASPSSSSAGSGGSSSSDSGSRGASQEKVASTWGDGNDYARQPSMAGGDGNGAATVDVSTTEKVKHNILRPQSHKKDLSLKNASQWAHAVATTKVQPNGKSSSDKRDELWDQFVTLDEKQLAKKKEELQKQERERHEKEQKEERERRAKAEQEAVEEAKKRDLAVQKEKELERLQGMAGTAKLTNQTDYELADMPKNDIDMNKVLGLKPIEADDDEY